MGATNLIFQNNHLSLMWKCTIQGKTFLIRNEINNNLRESLDLSHHGCVPQLPIHCAVLSIYRFQTHNNYITTYVPIVCGPDCCFN